jgi:hypothetical protein
MDKKYDVKIGVMEGSISKVFELVALNINEDIWK